MKKIPVRNLLKSQFSAFPLKTIHQKMSSDKSRGSFIVLEGCDRAGKTTQCHSVVKALRADLHDAVYMNFPNRSTESGKLIDAYLRKKSDFSDQGIHLLFTLNRWEAMAEMEKKLAAGTTLIVDRYSYSGVAFSAAKGLSLDWCKAPETGLLRPDAVLYLDLNEEAQKKRGGFGDERYEVPEMQKRVQQKFLALKDDRYWRVIDADKDPAELTQELRKIAEEVIKSEKKPLGKLW